MIRRIGSTLCISALLCSSLTLAAPPGGGSPQEVVERIGAATDNGDFAEMAACIEPEGRAEMAQGLLIASTMMVAFAGFGAEMAEGIAEAFEEGADAAPETEDAAAEDAAAEVEALTERYRAVLAGHGLEKMMDEDPSADEDLDSLLEGVDEIALIGDLMAFMQSFPQDEASSTETEKKLIPSEVTNYQIEGDRATADSPEGPIEFVRIDGRWFLVADQEGM